MDPGIDDSDPLTQSCRCNYPVLVNNCKRIMASDFSESSIQHHEKAR